MRYDNPCQQLRLDGLAVDQIPLNLDSRHEMVLLLRGLQGLYADQNLREEALGLVRGDVVGTASCRRGRAGLPLWTILVLAAARLGLDLDYDALQDLAENHRNLRMMMGIGDWQDRLSFNWRRIRDTLCRLRPETVDKISTLIISLGHRQHPEAAQSVRIDSFVMQTNVHYPTDIRQVGDALRCLVRHSQRLAEVMGSSLLRQHRHLQKRVRSLTLIAGRASASKGRGREGRLEKAVRELTEFADARCLQAMELLDQVRVSFDRMTPEAAAAATLERQQVYRFLSALAMVAGVARRRLVEHQDVPLSARLYSVFEAHTEMIVRGKIPNQVEFGHRVLVAEDAAGFILHAHVMANGRQDRDVVPTIARILTRRFPTLTTLSFDRGFHSVTNQERLKELIDNPCLPTTGVQAAAKQTEAASEEWHAARRRHPGIESAIGALQAGNGCERCRDRSKRGYRRYLALAILGRNLLTLGRLLIAAENPETLAARSRRGIAA